MEAVMTTYAVYEGHEGFEDWTDYLTVGKKYEALKDDGVGFNIITDDSDEIYCLWNGCNHLSEECNQNWKRVDE